MAHITYYDPSCPMLVHVVGDYEFSFSVASMPKENHTWLCNVMAFQLDRIYARGYEVGKAEVQNSVKKVLGL